MRFSDYLRMAMSNLWKRKLRTTLTIFAVVIGAILIALMVREGDIFTPEFFDALREATDEVFFIPGVDRTRVSSLFTPNVRFT